LATAFASFRLVSRERSLERKLGNPRGARAQAAQASARPKRGGKVSARVGSRRDAGGTLGTLREPQPLIRLLEALEAERIRYALIGMAAAAAQGVIASTLDVDIWIDLPPRQYIRVLNLARSLGAAIAANTVVYLEDGTPVNLVYEVTGLGSFKSEQRHLKRIRLYGHAVPVLRLERIVKSKEAVGRDKDKLHVIQIRDFLLCRRAKRRRPSSS
jgi:hypothetical protein